MGNKRFRAENDPEPGTSSGDAVRQWLRKDPGLVGSRIPAFQKPVLSPEMEETFASVTSAFQYYKLFQPDSFVDEIIYQSKLYSVQKDFSRKVQDCISTDTYRCTEAMLLMSGYHQVPRRKMIWEQKPDCHNSLIANAIRRDSADAMLKSLHFRDNSKIDGDCYFKVRPIFENLNKAGKYFLDGQHYSVDEAMIPYFGWHHTKQYIYGKPVRFGYKVWCLATSDGAGVYFEPYCGKDTNVVDNQLGQGPNVVLDLVGKVIYTYMQ